MAQELNKMLERDSARDFKPTTSEPNGFLKLVVSPLYEVVRAVSFPSLIVLGQYLNHRVYIWHYVSYMSLEILM